MIDDTKLVGAIALPEEFRFREVPKNEDDAVTPPPPLGPLANFTGTWKGTGFNTIFRPDHTPPAIDNLLELNLTQETIAFSAPLGSVPNRGSAPQADIFLNGVPYLQIVSDVTTLPATGIHVEPGLWMIVPPTAHPAIAESTLSRMASIPHGTTVNAQGTWTTINGAPTIPPVDITPFVIGQPNNKIHFPSQNVTPPTPLRIPADLGPYIANGTITQTILNDPNTILRNAIAHQHITATTQIVISTNPASPLFGGGTDNIAFLLGDPTTPPPNPNADSVLMTATFWIETVQETILVPPFQIGDPPHHIQGKAVPGGHTPVFIVTPPHQLKHAQELVVSYTQIQYSQLVLLNFATLSWPHVSLSTLTPQAGIIVPPSAWT